MVRRMIAAGAAAFRINFSHGSFDDHARRLGVVRGAADEMGVPVAVFGDLSGPKIRVGRISDPGVALAPGATVEFRSEEAGPAKPGSKEIVLPTTDDAFIGDVLPGHRVLINDGAIRLLAVDCAGGVVRCTVRVGGRVTSAKGINLPDSAVSVPSLTERDKECVRWGRERELDFFALSFVRRPEDIRDLRELLDPADRIPIIAKIEKPQAVERLDEIVDAADAVMIARGDLCLEMDLAQVPLEQKRILLRCSAWGKPCIVATQMLESMIGSASPTRAEASDVANAVLDGADALMLSGETAVGAHPDLVVETMRRIIDAAEGELPADPHVSSPPARLVESRYRTAALAHGAWHIARDIGAKLVVAWSQSGGTARYLSQNNFRIPIIAYSSSAKATRRMALLGGVTPLRTDPPPSGRLGHWTDMVERDLVARGWADRGDAVVLLAGKPLGESKATNSIAILHIGDPHGGYRSHAS